MPWFFIRLLTFAAAAAVASSQPRAVEVWGSIGGASAAGDESSIGSGVIYGGGIAVPFTRHLAFEIDVARMRAERFESTTRLLVSPALVGRWGKESIYGFVGGGLGVQTDRSSSVAFEPGPVPGQPVMTRYRFSDTGITLHGRGGFVARPAANLIVRVELFSAWRFVMPTVGVKVGIGYRF